MGDDNTYAAGIETSAKRRDISQKVAQDVESIDRLLVKIKAEVASQKIVGGDTSTSPLALKLAILLGYIPDILKAFDFRKSGGAGNIKMFKLLMRD
jgi:hypothetical protein